MSRLLDTSEILASLDADEPRHAACDALVAAGGHVIFMHALAETFSILAGGRQGRRPQGSVASRLIERSVLPFVPVQALGGDDMMAALAECGSRGVRGGAVYDWLHLAAARKAGAEALITLDLRDYQVLARPGDPPVAMP